MTTWYVSPSGTDNDPITHPGAGTSIPLAWATIQFSLNQLTKQPGQKELLIVGAPAGGYRENVTMKGAQYSDITIRGWTLHGQVTVQSHQDYDWGAFCEGRPPINGGQNGSVFTIEDAKGIVLQDLQITNGKADRGAGVHATRSQVDLVACCIHGNTATPHIGSGGGLAFEQCNPVGVKSKIDRCVIVNNKAGKDGAGGWVSGNVGSIKISKTEIHDNVAEENGGGLALTDCKDIDVVEHCLFGGAGHKNTAKNGGAIYIQANVGPINIGDPSATADQDKNKILDNVATEAGGGIRIFRGRAHTIVGGTDIKTNHANATGGKTADGGGIAIQQFDLTQIPSIKAVLDARVELDFNTIIEENDADRHGGGLFATTGSNVTLHKHVTIHKNSAPGAGGGIYSSVASNITARFCDITDNHAANGNGGGVFLSNGWLDFAGVTLEKNGAVYGGGAFVETRLPLAPAEQSFVLNVESVRVGNVKITGGGTTGPGSISENHADKDGGGLVVSGDRLDWRFDPNVVLKGVRVDKNTAQGFGGGLFLDTVRSVTVELNALTRNAAGSSGGGLYVKDVTPPPANAVTVASNTTISDNRAASGAGIDLVRCIVGQQSVIGNTFTNNTLTGAGGAGADVLFNKCAFKPQTTPSDLAKANLGPNGTVPDFVQK